MTDQTSTDRHAAETALATIAGDRDWREFEQQLKALYAPDCTDIEWDIFKQETTALGLNPIKREYIPLKIKAKRTDRAGNTTQAAEYRGYITMAGLLAIAERSGRLDAIDGPHYAGEKSNGQFLEYWPSNWPAPDAARVTVWRTDKTRGTTAVVTMKRARTWYDKEKNKTELSGLWKTDPAMMLGVRATTDALKKAGLVAAEPIILRLATDDGEPIDAADDDDRARISAGRRIHAIGRGRNLDHQDIHQVANHITGEIISLADRPPDDVQATADFIEISPAASLGAAANVAPEAITGEPKAVAPEPEPEADAATPITAAQLAWLEDNRDAIDFDRLTDAQKQDYADREALTYHRADALIMAASRALHTNDGEPMTWSEFWRYAKAAGIKNPAEFAEATGFAELPDEAGEAYAMLKRDIEAPE